ncbi:MAG: hypothetical protein ABIV94_08730 [Acidimicrobiales bacterium]
MRSVLFVVGYPAAISVIVRFVPVVRERRLRWLVVHHLGVACIVAGWALGPDWGAAAVNATWLVSSTAWYVLGSPARSR